MDENMNNNATEQESSWDDWSSMESEFSAEAEESEDAAVETEEADQPESEEAEGADTDNEDGGETEGADQTFTLKHLDETREVSRDEVITLAQKGLDYDRIRQKLEQTEAERDKNSAAESEAQTFLKELADRQHITVEELIDNMRAEILSRDEGIDITVARGRIQNQKERAALERERSAVGSGEDAARQKAIEDFVAEYPDVDAKSIPRTVWDEFSRTGNLVQAYRVEENRQLKQQIQDLNQKLAAKDTNTKNKSRTTGSQKSDGATEAADAFMKAWYDGT